DLRLRRGHSVQLFGHRMDQGQNAGSGSGYSQYAYCPRAGLAAGKDSLFHSGRRRHQGGGPELQGKASGVIMGILLTQQAADHINRYIEKRGKGLGLRLGVRTTGCSGMAYKLEYVDEPNADDQVFEQRGVRVYIDPKSLPFLEGTQLDYAREGLNEGFKFSNPNEKATCGCGESFTV